MNKNPYAYSLTTRLKEKDIFKFMNAEQGSFFLDVGCGLGYFIGSVATQYPRIKRVGIDIDYRSLQYSRQDIPAHFLQSDAQDLPFRDNLFDRILYSDVIEHTVRDRESIREIKRVAKPGAIVVLTTEAKEGLLTGTRFNLLGHTMRGTPEYHVREGYTAHELTRLLMAEGMTDIEYSFSTVLFGELCIEFTKIIYMLKNKKLGAQSDVMDVSRSRLFGLYRLVLFPVFFFISVWENKILQRLLKGHVLIIKAKVNK